MRIQRKRKRHRSGTLAALLSVLVITGASMGLAYLWQSAENARIAGAQAEPGAEQSSQAGAAEEAVSSGSREAPSEPQPASEAQAPLSEPDGASQQVPAAREDVGGLAAAGAVPESPKVDNSYFSDAIFFGDSLSTGIPLYQMAGNPDTVAYPGINPQSANTEQVISTSDGKMTLLEAARQYGDKKKVYIMLGGNGLWMEETAFVSGYQTFIDSVKAQYPGAVIYLQSILPVTEDAHIRYESANNQTIRDFNRRIEKLAQENGAYYLDVAQAVMDENGALPKQASPLDGMHLTPEYYAKWFDYLKTHTVEETKR